MAKTYPLTYEEVTDIQGHLRACKAIADVLMCGGAQGCATDTLDALGEVVYYRLEAIETLLGVGAPDQGATS